MGAVGPAGALAPPAAPPPQALSDIEAAMVQTINRDLSISPSNHAPNHMLPRNNSGSSKIETRLEAQNLLLNHSRSQDRKSRKGLRTSHGSLKGSQFYEPAS
jgi:hypothetical protein